MDANVRIGDLEKHWDELPTVAEKMIGPYPYYEIAEWSFEDGEMTEDDHWTAIIANITMIAYLRSKTGD